MKAQVEYFEDHLPQANDYAQLKVPPHSHEAEQSLLGGLMIESRYLDDVIEIIKPEDFFAQAHRDIYNTILRVWDKGLGVDCITVAENMANLDRVGGIAYLAEIVGNTPSTANLCGYARMIRDRAIERQICAAGMAISDAGFDESIDVDEKVKLVNQAVQGIGETDAEKDILSNNAALKDWIHNIDELHQSGGTQGLMTGLRDLDKRLGGLQKSDLIILAARPSMGKSTMAFQIAAHAVTTGPAHCYVFSLEMSRRQVYNKLGSHLGGINLTHLHHVKLDEADWPKLTAAVSKLKDRNLTIDDSAGLHVNQICARARRAHRRLPLDLIVIDYLQLVRGDGDNRNAEIGSITRALKGLAKELDCPVLVLSQLNRGVEQRANKRPHNADLRDSGEIEQDADVIMFIYRDEVHNEDTRERGIAEIITSKQRNGEIGTDRVATRLDVSTFSDLAWNYEPPTEPDRKTKASGMDY